MSAENAEQNQPEDQDAPNEETVENQQPAEEAAKDDATAMKEQLLRAMAEVENVKKRAEREKQDAMKYATANFARDLLAVADTFERALASLPEDQQTDDVIKNFVSGIELTNKELQKAFEKAGIEKIEATGQPFDYNLHQAMTEIETIDHPAGTVVQEMQAGYMLKDRLLRPAMVAVAKGGEESDTPPEDIEGIDTTA